MAEALGYLEPELFSEYDTPSESSPERKLLSAILERAICDLFCKEQEIKRTVRVWFNDSKSTYPGSFRWVAEGLGFENGAHHKLRDAIFKIDFFRFHSRAKVNNAYRRVVYNVRH